MLCKLSIQIILNIGASTEESRDDSGWISKPVQAIGYIDSMQESGTVNQVTSPGRPIHEVPGVVNIFIEPIRSLIFRHVGPAPLRRRGDRVVARCSHRADHQGQQ